MACASPSPTWRRPPGRWSSGRPPMLEALSLSQLVEPLQGGLEQGGARFAPASTDGGARQPGQLVVAVVGPRVDGHACLAGVAGKGAAAALVSRFVPEVALPQLVVADTRLALGRLGTLNREAFQGPVA